MELTALFFILLLLVLVVGFYMGVPMRWFKHRSGRDLDVGGGRPRRREREQH